MFASNTLSKVGKPTGRSGGLGERLHRALQVRLSRHATLHRPLPATSDHTHFLCPSRPMPDFFQIGEPRKPRAAILGQ
jgi:hypothetical protein